MLDWVIARIKEPTTWIGITGLLTAAGVNIAPDLAQSIVTAGVAIGGALAILLREKGTL